jgi:SPP1 gp7 family putative phage head morphogenesis protein
MAEDFIPNSTINYINKAKKDITKSLVGSLVKKYANEIDDGVKAGLSSKQIADNLRKKDSSIKSKTIANTIARTLLHFSYSMGAITDMLEDEMIVAFRFNAVNDSRVSDICESLDGKIISKDEVYNFLPPLHYNCRSVLEPIFINENIPPDKLINKDTYKTKEYQEKIEPLMKKQESFLKYQREDIELMREEVKQEVKEPEVIKPTDKIAEIKDYIANNKITNHIDAIKIGKQIDDVIKGAIKDDSNISKLREDIKNATEKRKEKSNQYDSNIEKIVSYFEKFKNDIIKQQKEILDLRYEEKDAAKKIEYNNQLKNLDILYNAEKIKANNELDKMYDAKAKDIDLINYRNIIDDATNKIIDNHFPILQEALKDLISFGNNNGTIQQKYSKNSSENNIKAFEEISKLMPTKFLELSSKYEFTLVQREDRAGQRDGNIFFDASEKISAVKQILLHEFSHRIEYLSKTVRTNEKEYYNKRTENDKLEPLNTIKGFEKYNKDEYTKKDKWLDPYMGKNYDDTYFEILSMAIPSIIMGIDDLNNNKILDPETRHFVLGLLAGAEL